MGEALLNQVMDTFAPHPPERMGLAVSGGSDSIAMMHLVHRMSQQTGTKLRVVTVDHGLRDTSADEAAWVGSVADGLGLAHDCLRWQGWDQHGNLQNEARKARYGLMAEWAAAHDIGTVALGHTADDQAETFLMRLARRSGVDGLSGMAVRRMQDGIQWVRPLLSARRSELKDYLRAADIGWIEDPSNDDPTFDRIKARRALAILSDLGIDAEGLSVVAEHMSQASTALNWQAFQVMHDIGCVDGGAVVICARRLRTQPDEIQRRLLSRAIQWVSGGAYSARHGAIATVMKTLASGSGATVDGCQLILDRGQIWIFREYNAVRDTIANLGTLWDGRWRVSTTTPTALPAEGLELRALGREGLLQCPDWREKRRPQAHLLSSPAVWSGETVVAAPVAGYGQNWYAEVDGGEESFFAALLTH